MTITEKVMKLFIEGGILVMVTHFNTREGKKELTKMILLYFSDEQLPKRVMIGYGLTG